jgi:hypothetical protein
LHGMQEVTGSTPVFSTQKQQSLREIWGFILENIFQNKSYSGKYSTQ